MSRHLNGFLVFSPLCLYLFGGLPFSLLESAAAQETPISEQSPAEPAQSSNGEPLFYGNCLYGSDNQLRGYTAGRYLDRYMMATQLEYRLVLPWRFGLVGFGGMGGAIPGKDQLRTKQFLPAGGTGIRFSMSKKYHVNLRTDFAWGKDNFTWSMAMGEAF